jgi:hypothetical protein
VEYQLREYDVKPGEMADFVREWREQIVPLRSSFGFDVVGAWTVGDERFVWIIGHEDFATADRAYYESPERAALVPDPTRHLARVGTTMLTPVALGV